jgi:hypothetical protein
MKGDGTEFPSYVTFRRVYRTNWASCLRFRDAGQHARCATCARFSKARRDAATTKDKDHWAAQHGDHIAGVMADRRVDMRVRTLSSMHYASGVGGESIMYMTVDGMDQAKFKCPRNLESSKEWDNCWRPQLHLVGCLMPGLLEVFYVMDMDVPSDSNLTMTVLARTLEHAERVMRFKNIAWPEHLVLLARQPCTKAFSVSPVALQINQRCCLFVCC